MGILVAGLGNVLRGDDGFGVEVARRLQAGPIPDGVRVLELGIGGIHLVQELLDGVEALVVVDAVDVGRPPGTVLVIRPTVEDVRELSLTERHDRLADMHYATPDRAFVLARGLGVLPETTWLVGCQPFHTGWVSQSLSATVAPAVEVAAAEVKALVAELGCPWPAGDITHRSMGEAGRSAAASGQAEDAEPPPQDPPPPPS